MLNEIKNFFKTVIMFCYCLDMIWTGTFVYMDPKASLISNYMELWSYCWEWIHGDF